MFYWHQSYHGNKMAPLCFLLAFYEFFFFSFFFQKSLKGARTYLGCLGWWQSLNKFYKSVLEIFWNKVSRVIKTVNKHAIDIISEHLKKTIRSGNAVSSHSGLIPSENCTKKEGDCFGRLRERGIWLAYVRLLSLPFLHVIWSTPTNFTVILKTARYLKKKKKTLTIPWLNVNLYLRQFF